MFAVTEIGGLSPEAVAAVDRAGLAGDVLAQPDHIEDALERCAAASLPELAADGGLDVCGMGGSAIGGDLAAAVLGARARRRVTVVRGYGDAAVCGPERLVACASYSGNTEETLSCYEAAGAVGAPRVAITTGGELRERCRVDGVPVIELPPGLQPRAAVVYLLVAMLELAARCGAAPSLLAEIESAAGLLRSLGTAWGPAAALGSPAKALAGRLQGTVPVVHGTGLTAPVARRWKGQINENAKAAAFWSELPEADHNELCAWEGTLDLPLRAVFLDAPALDRRLATRLALTADEVAAAGVPVEQVHAVGSSPLKQLLSLVLLGDLVSIYLAVLAGRDPTPVQAIERFKAALAAFA